MMHFRALAPFVVIVYAITFLRYVPYGAAIALPVIIALPMLMLKYWAALHRTKD